MKLWAFICGGNSSPLTTCHGCPDQISGNSFSAVLCRSADQSSPKDLVPLGRCQTITNSSWDQTLSFPKLGRNHLLNPRVNSTLNKYLICNLVDHSEYMLLGSVTHIHMSIKNLYWLCHFVIIADLIWNTFLTLFQPGKDTFYHRDSISHDKAYC